MRWPATISWLDRLRSFSSLTFTRAGDALLATVSPASFAKGEPSGSRIWRFGLDGTAIQLTRGPNSDGLARPAPVGDAIAFVSDRRVGGKMEPFLLGALGEASPLGEVPGSVEDLAWSEDGLSVVVLSADRGLNGGPTNGATRLSWREADDPEVAAPGAALRRLFRIDVASGRTEEVGPADLSVWEFCLVPGGAVAIVSRDASERGWYHPKLVHIDFSTRRPAVIHETAWQIQGLAADKARRRVAFLEGWSSDRGLVAGEMCVFDLESGAVSVLAADRQSNVTALRWREDDTIWFIGWQNLGTVYGLVSLTGDILWRVFEEATIGGNPFVSQMAISPDGQSLGAVRETIGAPQEIFFKASGRGDWQRLSDFNEAIAAGFPDYPDIHHITWSGKDGLALESFAIVPKNTDPGTHPMVVDIHGGPCMSIKYGFDPGEALGFAAAGYVVFLPNYRGNVGWGQTFTKMNLGDPAGAEFDDIMAGIDRCIALGLADPERISVTGASYGGFLSWWAVAVTDRFKAAIPVSSISDQLSCHYSCDHDFHEFINGGSLTLARYRRIANDRSPLSRLNYPKTPTLLIQGSDDRCTPLGQAQEFHAALKERGVTTELVVYPREGHGLREREHRFDAWRRRIDWFDRYLGLASIG